MRLTKDVVSTLLNLNEGFKDRTYYKSRNSEEENFYEIIGGKLKKRSVGKTSWADSRYDKTYDCDETQTRNFLRKHLGVLKTK